MVRQMQLSSNMFGRLLKHAAKDLAQAKKGGTL